MSVDPVHSSSPVIEHTTPQKKQPTALAPRSADSGNRPLASASKVEISKPQSLPVPQLIPEHEVKIVLDSPDNNTLVYQVLDKQSGDVVLQVPSAAQLRGVHDTQELLQRIEARGKTPAANETSAPVTPGEGTTNGNQL
jgi:hypothetical protein